MAHLRMSYLIYVTLSNNALTYSVACIPISAEWNVPQPGQCVSKTALYTAGSVTDVFGDSKPNLSPTAWLIDFANQNVSHHLDTTYLQRLEATNAYVSQNRCCCNISTRLFGRCNRDCEVGVRR